MISAFRDTTFGRYIKVEGCNCRMGLNTMLMRLDYAQLLYSLSTFQGCDRDCQKECIMVHNKYRANHDAPPLVFDQKLADEAQALIDKGVFKHSDWVELKNNGAALAWGSLFPTFTAVIKNWHDEGTYYDYQTGAPKKQSQV